MSLKKPLNFSGMFALSKKAQLKTLKNKLISSQNDYKCLLEKFETFANLNCELSTKIEQLETSAYPLLSMMALLKGMKNLRLS
jgi:hypothetical protein